MHRSPASGRLALANSHSNIIDTSAIKHEHVPPTQGNTLLHLGVCVELVLT
jgi:hypothetical protein